MENKIKIGTALFLGIVCLFALTSAKLADDPLIAEWLREQREPIPYQEDVFVTIRNGTIRGTTLLDPNNATMYAFLGIPYAAPPVGQLRFKVTYLSINK